MWLTPDASTPLTTLSPNDVYVVGGLIDRSVMKNHTLELAARVGVRAARLPIREYAPVSNAHPILDVVAVGSILSSVHSGMSWRDAMKVHVPARHMLRRLREERAG